MEFDLEFPPPPPQLDLLVGSCSTAQRSVMIDDDVKQKVTMRCNPSSNACVSVTCVQWSKIVQLYPCMISVFNGQVYVTTFGIVGGSRYRE